MCKASFPNKKKFMDFGGFAGMLCINTFNLCKIFVLGIYAIPSGSMEDTLKPGDRVLVSKLKYGPRLPRSPLDIPLVSIVFQLGQGISDNNGIPVWGYKRMKGYSAVERNDIVVFNHPVTRKVLIKRCIGIPGDTIKIVNGNILIRVW